MKPEMLLFSTRSYAYLREELAALHGNACGSVDVKIFPDGERYQRIVTCVEDRHVALIGGTISDADTLELYDLACGLVQCGARSLTLVIPYFGYSTMERPVKSGDVVTAKARTRLLSSIPMAIEGNRVVLLDLHSEGIPYYFESEIHPTHVYAKPLIVEAARRLRGNDFVLACTDAGRAKWVESLANDLNVPASFVFKRRLSGEKTEVTTVSAQVSGRHVIIYDDMIRTGSSLLNAARAYRAAGAISVAAIATHGVFPKDALQKLRESGAFDTIICTNTHPRAVELKSDFLQVVSVAGLL
jgi:ribose-phosphate pyrophosphokinase